MQRLPDSLDNSREQNVPSDDEEKLGMFMNCDLNLLFDSTNASITNSAKSSKLKMSQKDVLSQNLKMSQGVTIGDGSSLRNHLAMFQMRDISDLDVKKINNKENEDPSDQKPSKERQQQLRQQLKHQKKQKEADQKKKLVEFFDFETDIS